MIIILIAICFVILFGGKKKTPRSSRPMYSRSVGFEGHYDFLEMHGFMTPEERKLLTKTPEEWKATSGVISLNELLRRKPEEGL